MRSRGRRLVREARAAIAARLSPERTRQPSLVERLTVARLSTDTLVRLNRYLELSGRLTTVVWVAFMASLVLGVHWKEAVEDAVNSGKPVRGAAPLAVILPTLAFVAAHSVIGWAAGGCSASSGAGTSRGSRRARRPRALTRCDDLASFHRRTIRGTALRGVRRIEARLASNG